MNTPPSAYGILNFQALVLDVPRYGNRHGFTNQPENKLGIVLYSPALEKQHRNNRHQHFELDMTRIASHECESLH